MIVTQMKNWCMWLPWRGRLGKASPGRDADVPSQVLFNVLLFSAMTKSQPSIPWQTPEERARAAVTRGHPRPPCAVLMGLALSPHPSPAPYKQGPGLGGASWSPPPSSRADTGGPLARRCFVHQGRAHPSWLALQKPKSEGWIGPARRLLVPVITW